MIYSSEDVSEPDEIVTGADRECISVTQKEKIVRHLDDRFIQMVGNNDSLVLFLLMDKGLHLLDTVGRYV